jgi:hypothetical protein
MPDVDRRLVPFDVGVAYTSDEGQRHGRYVNVYSLSSVKYCLLITFLFITDLLLKMGLWIVTLMADDLLRLLRHPVGLIKVVMPKQTRN